MKKALITGVTGQDGSYLAELLLEKGYGVWGLIRRASSFNRERIEHLYFTGDHYKGRLNLIYGDLADSGSLRSMLTKVRPDEIYNLGAQSHVGISFEIPEYTSDITGLGTVRLLEAVRDICPGGRFYQASSSELFGKVLETPQKEDTPFWPRSPYACAKALSFYITRNYREAYGMFACNGILFNHESPRRGENFVTRKITLSLSRISHGLQDRLVLGNLDARRDWGYAKDYVEAMWLMLQQDDPADYIIATGQSRSVREFVELAAGHAGMRLGWKGSGLEEKGIDDATGRTVVEVDPRYIRPAEVDFLLGDPSNARRQLGWDPSKTSFEELVRLMMEHDLENARMEAALKTALQRPRTPLGQGLRVSGDGLRKRASLWG